MADLTLAIKIRADGTAEVVGGLDRIESALRDLGPASRQASSQSQQGMAGVGSAARQAEPHVSSLKSQLIALGQQVAVFEALRRAVSSFFSTSVEAENLQAMLRAVTGGADQAAQAFAALRQEAAQSPAQLTELVSAYTQLTRRGLDASLEAIRDFQAIATGKLGATLDDAIQAVLDASVGQGERLAEFGIEFSKMKDNITISMGDLTMTVGNDADEIVAALRRIAQEKFSAGVEEQIGTMSQRLSNLGDAWDELMGAISDTGAWEALKGIISTVTGWIQSLSSYVRIAQTDFQMLGEIWTILTRGANAVEALDFGPSLTRAEAIQDAIRRRNEAIRALETQATQPVSLPDLERAAAGHNAAADAAERHGKAVKLLNVPYADLIAKASEMYGVDQRLIAAIIEIESGYRSWIKNTKSSATGLMQVLKGTWEWMGGGPNRTDPWENIRVGTKYLAYLQQVAQKTGKDLEWVLRHYGENTDAYVNKAYRALEKLGAGEMVIEGLADAQKAAADAAKLHDEALAKLEAKTRAYVKTLKQKAQAAQDALLKAQDPEAYKEVVRAREQLEAQDMAGMYDQEAQAALQAKYAAEDLLEAYQVRQGWAQQVLQGFDSLWSNMISGAENAMDALQKTLKSWLYAIGNWLLKQTLIIPITAAVFSVSQESLGGGLLDKMTGGSGGGGFFSGIGNLFGGTSIADAIGLGIEKLGDFFGAGGMQDLGASIFANALPNWGMGLAGIAGRFIGSQFGGYGGLGGSLGGMGGAMLGQALIPVPVLGAAIGAALGSLGGGFLGGLFGKEKIKGGVGYYDFNKRRAGAAHGDTDPAVVEMMQTLGSTMEGLDKALRASEGFGDMWNFGASMWLDTDTAGRVDAAYASYSRGLQKASFKAAEDAASWFVEQMTADIQKQFELHAPDLAALTQGMNVEEIMALAQSIGAIANAANVMDISLREAYETVNSLAQGGETFAQAWQRLATELGAVNLALEGFRMPLLEMSPAGLKAADALVQLLGGLDGFVSATSYFYENFFTESERQEMAVQRATQAIADFNAAMGLSGDAYIDTKGELRAFVQGLDLTTEAGQKAFAAAMQVAPALVTYAEAMLATGDAAADALAALEAAEQAVKDAEQALTDLRASFADLRTEWQGIKQTFADILNPDTRTSGERLRGYGQEAMSLLEGIKDGWDAMELDTLRGTLTGLADAARDAMSYLDGMISSIHGLVASALDTRRQAREAQFQEFVQTLSPEAQTDIYGQQTARSIRRGLAANTLAEMEDAIASFAENAGRYIDSLTDPKQKAWAEINFERLMLAAQEKADRMAEAQREALRAAAEEMKARIIEAFQQGGQVMLDAANANLAAANTQVSAANAQISAANTPIQVDVTVTQVAA